jgi:hypothetical protein
LRSYPWAGSLSTAHTIFYYDRFGSAVFKDLAGQVRGRILGAPPAQQESRLNLAKLALAEEREAEIWHELTHVRRHISRQTYDTLAAQLPRLRLSVGRGRS